MGRGREALCGSDGDSQGQARGRSSFYVNKHGQPGVDVQESGPMGEAEKLEVGDGDEQGHARCGPSSTLTSMGNLASTLWSQGRWDEAEKLLGEVTETSKAGPDSRQKKIIHVSGRQEETTTECIAQYGSIGLGYTHTHTT